MVLPVKYIPDLLLLGREKRLQETVLSLLNELSRRGVTRVVIAYLAGAWLVLQIADLAFPAFGVPDRVMAVLIMIAAIGIFPAIILTWVFEWTPGGVVRDSGRDSVGSARTLDKAIIVILVLAVGVFAVDKFVLDPQRDLAREQEVAASARSNALVESFGDRSIAVLPFANMSSDPEQEYFSDGISEEILNLLARIKELRVISRSSSFAFRGVDINITEVAKKLNVDYVLEGSVRKSGNKLRITAQLIEGRTDRHVWSNTYDRTEGDVFEIQDDISAMIIDQLKIELLAEAPKSYRTDPETHALFLRAQNYAVASGLIGDFDAYELLKKVIERDPDYVPALVRLAHVTSYLPTDGPHAYISEEEKWSSVPALVAHVLELDANNGIANAYTGYGIAVDGAGVEAALPWFEKGIRVEPNNVEVLRVAGVFAGMIGDAEAKLRLGMRSVALDPNCFNCYYNVIDGLSDAGRLDEAESYARRRVAVAPRGWAPLGTVLLKKGDKQGALDSFDKMETEDERWHLQLATLFDMGRTEEFESLMAAWTEKYAEQIPVKHAHLLIIQGKVDAAYDYIDEKIGTSTLGCDWSQDITGFEEMKKHPRWLARCGEDADVEEQTYTIKLPDNF